MKKNRRNYYRILHVQPDAPLEIIKASYRALMLKLDMHPDRGGDHDSAALINEAYRVVTDSEKRRAYDRELLQSYSAQALGGMGEYRPAAAPPPSPTRSVVPEPDYYRPLIQYYCAFCVTPHGYGQEPPAEAACSECHSPLSYGPKLQNVRSGRRTMHRVSANDPFEFYTNWPGSASPGVVRDLSPNGIRFICGLPLELHGAIKLSHKSLEAVARVRYCRRAAVQQYTIGAEFITIYLHNDRGTFLSTTT